MKFKIRYADQIVGIFIVLSLVSLIFVIVMLGRSQRWFSKDYSYSTILPSATGLSKNMTVQFRGFTIGSVKNFYLTENDDVEVIFVIHDEYHLRVKKGSLVEMQVSPIGLGNQFLFHFGKGDVLAEGSFVPVVGSAQAMELIRQGLAVEPYYDDSITILVGRINAILADLEEALGPGSDSTEIGKIMGSVQKTLSGVEELPQTLDQTIESVIKMLDGILAELNPILADVSKLTAGLSDPDSIVFKLLDSDGEVYTDLVKSFNSISSILDSLDKTAAFLPPQIPGLLMELRVTMKSAEDVLVSLANNPLLRGGVPQKLESQGGGTNPRDISF